MRAAEEGRSLGELVASAADDLSGLVRDEIALAKAEVRRDFGRALWGSIWAAVGATFALFSLALATFALEHFLRKWWDVPLSVSCSVVAVLYLLVAGYLIKLSVEKFTGVRGTERAIRSVKTSAALLGKVKPRPRRVPAPTATPAPAPAQKGEPAA